MEEKISPKLIKAYRNKPVNPKYYAAFNITSIPPPTSLDIKKSKAKFEKFYDREEVRNKDS
jgi:hypothetical protein